jgi:hypothetical protein
VYTEGEADDVVFVLRKVKEKFRGRLTFRTFVFYCAEGFAAEGY